MLRTRNFFLLIGVVLTLCSCGVKKNATANVESASIETEMNKKNATKADSLPDFLHKYANDSTIHVNWVYGIPFIIDDSVPMFLPPIDKNPEGYVSRADYKKRMWNPGRVSYYWGEVLPTDTILWLNKVLCDLEVFSLSLERGFEYIYYIYYVKSKEQQPTLIEIELLAIRTPECKQDGRTMHFQYYFLGNGDLVGKCNDKINHWGLSEYFSNSIEKRIILTFIRHSAEFEENLKYNI